MGLFFRLTSPVVRGPVTFARCRACLTYEKTRWLSTSSRIFEYEARYSRHDQERILQVINAAEAEALTKFNISKGRVGNIVRYRSKKGPFREVEELLEVDGFGVKILEKFCESVLGMSCTSKAELKPRGIAFCSPKPSESLLKNIGVVTALQLTPRKLSWAQLSRERQLLNWRTVSVNPSETKRYDISHVMDMVVPLMREIPKADAYVIEDSAGSGGNAIPPAFFGVHLQLARLQAALVALLESEALLRDVGDGGGADGDVHDRRVFAMKPSHVSKLFGVRVGGERVSGQKLVASVVAGDADGGCGGPLPSFARLATTDADGDGEREQWLELFEQSEPVDREMLSNALLLSLAFQGLVIEEAPECIRGLRS